MNDFVSDDRWQKEMRDQVLAPGFYGSYAVEGRYVVMDKGRIAKEMQRVAVDTIVQGADGTVVAIEEKIVRWPDRNEPYTAFALETQSCTVPGHESAGWMTYAEADYLLYCFAQRDGSLICHLIDFPKLQDWFWKNDTKFNVFRMKTKNRTAGRLVPIVAVEQNVPTWRRHVLPSKQSVAA